MTNRRNGQLVRRTVALFVVLLAMIIFGSWRHTWFTVIITIPSLFATLACMFWLGQANVYEKEIERLAGLREIAE